jgi:indole-3-glycerol phosphate synthase
MTDLLRAILADRAAERRPRRRNPGTRGPDPGPPRDFRAAIAAEGLSIVAEIKRRSPSAGRLRSDLDPAELAQALASAGAAALSVLTEPRWFDGSVADLVLARAATSLPVLRKDFLLDPEEVLESRLLGADAVLLIVRILGPGQLDESVRAAEEASIASVVEAHDERDLERAVASRATVIGINSRDLETLRVDRERALALRSRVPPGRLVLAESGVRTAAEAHAVRAHGFDGLLVGTVLMRAANAGAMLRELSREVKP